jgi:hypothetical protein
MKRAIIACLGLLASSFAPIAPRGLVSAARAQDTSRCEATNHLPQSGGFHWGAPYVVPGPYDYLLEFAPSEDGQGIVASITARSPLTIRCPVLDSNNKPIGKYGTNGLLSDETLVEVVCDPHITAAGLALGGKDEETCGVGGSWHNR